ncbi:MAG: (2Fe-2S)-binding protein [Planctomycetota bacterium]
MPVDRCVCHRVPFTELAERLRDGRAVTLEDLADQTGCSTGCGMCEPYVRLVIATGRTSYSVLPPHEIERILEDASTDSAADPGETPEQ